jgi:hypothetical protein
MKRTEAGVGNRRDDLESIFADPVQTSEARPALLLRGEVRGASPETWTATPSRSVFRAYRSVFRAYRSVFRAYRSVFRAYRKDGQECPSYRLG